MTEKPDYRIIPATETIEFKGYSVITRQYRHIEIDDTQQYLINHAKKHRFICVEFGHEYANDIADKPVCVRCGVK